MYEKVGVVCMMDNAIHVFKDESLSKEGPFVLNDTVANHVWVDNLDSGSAGDDQVNP